MLRNLTRQKKQFYFNPPYELNVQTNVAKEIFKALEKTIPKGCTLFSIGTLSRFPILPCQISKRRYQVTTEK